jgi:hypothetical protein
MVKTLARIHGEGDSDGTPKIIVIADETWSKKSYNVNYNALSGVVSILILVLINMTGNITTKCCKQHVANCCLGVLPATCCQLLPWCKTALTPYEK